MNASGKTSKCTTDACGASLSKASKQRFVLFSKVSNEDEIYQVQLILYDGALEKRVATVKESCELCAASEVNDTLTNGIKKLAKPFAVPAPARPAAKKTPAGVVSVQVRSTPSGSDVFLGKVSKGKSPVSFNVKPGSHTIRVTKTGFISQERKISALDRTVKLKFTLKAAPPSAVAAQAKKPAKKVETDKAVSPVEPVGSSYNGLAWSFGVGGLALMGVGSWLVLIDGEITCTDGRGRRECPNVYNTNGFGLTAFGIGAVLVGAGSALIIDELIRSRRNRNRAKKPAEAKKVSIMAAPLNGGATMGLMGTF